MRFIRPFLICLLLVAALAVLVVAAAFNPYVQTWLVERELTGHPGWTASVKSLWSDRTKTEVTDVRLEIDGAVLTLPAAKANLSLKAALWDRKLPLENLVAKGWTLDLSHQPASGKTAPLALTAPASASSAPPPSVASADKLPPALQTFLSRLQLPPNFSLTGVDLEGDILFAAPPSPTPARLHVVLKGGRLSAGESGEFTVKAVCAQPNATEALQRTALEGRLTIALSPTRTLRRLAFSGQLFAGGNALPSDLLLAAAVETTARADEENYTVVLTRGTRKVANLAAVFSAPKSSVSGTWALDLRDSDLAGFFSASHLLAFEATGRGTFATDPTFARVQAAGQFTSTTSKWGAIAPDLARLGTLNLSGEFAATHRDGSLAVDRLNVSIAGTRPIASVQSRQAFSLEEKTGALKLAKADADWLHVSLAGLPIAWLANEPGALALAGGDLTGELVVRPAGGGFAVRATTPLVANDVSVHYAGTPLGQALDLSLALLADYSSSAGWQLASAPLAISSAGRPLASIDGKLTPPSSSRRTTVIAAKWSADLEALTGQPVLNVVTGLRGKSASGNFSAKRGRTTDWSNQFTIVGHDPAHSLTADVTATASDYSGWSFRAPVKIAFGPDVTEFSADGTWAKEKSGHRLELEVNGVKAFAEHLELLAGTLPAFGGTSVKSVLSVMADAPSTTPNRTRDAQPFWGDVTGHARFNFYQLRAANREINEVTGNLIFAADSLQLENGRAVIAPPPPITTAKATSLRTAPAPATDTPPTIVTADSTISFDAAAELPYRLKAAAAVDVIDGAAWFSAPTAAKPAREPAIEGRWAATGSLTGSGANLSDLFAHRQEELHLTSRNGIFSFLKVSVADALPPTPTPVSDTLDTVGSTVGNAVGAVFGFKVKTITSGVTQLSKPAEAVVDLTYQVAELSYDQLSVTATRGADRTIRLNEIAVTGPNTRLTGSGQITPSNDLPLRAQPLSLDLQLGTKGLIAKRLTTAGLLSTEVDSTGFKNLRETLHFGGTLEQIAPTTWRDLLTKAATQTPPPEKK